MNDQTYILHHYWTSPFSEKVRLVFGLKNLSWASVLIPPVMPKPDFTPLTGGYRKTPAMQIGADIYCDTRLIIDLLEEMHPENSVYAGYSKGQVHAVATWAEDQLFWPMARYITAINADHVGSALHNDRAAMRGNPPPPLDLVKAAAPRNLPEMLINFDWVEDMLNSSGAYVLGERPCLADIAVYHAIWFLGVMPISGFDQISAYPKILEWMDRVKAIGHGDMSPLDSKEALTIAGAAEPKPFGISDTDTFAPPLGSNVGVKPKDYGRDMVEGELVYVGRNHVTLLRKDVEALGDMAVHFPRQQYILKPLK